MTQPKTGSKFTPGPWSVRDGQDVLAISGSETRLVAECHAGHREERQANARLISHAPEMYDLLEQLADRARGVDGALDIGYSTWKSLCHKARRIKAALKVAP